MSNTNVSGIADVPDAPPVRWLYFTARTNSGTQLTSAPQLGGAVCFTTAGQDGWGVGQCVTMPESALLGTYNEGFAGVIAAVPPNMQALDSAGKAVAGWIQVLQPGSKAFRSE